MNVVTDTASEPSQRVRTEHMRAERVRPERVQPAKRAMPNRVARAVLRHIAHRPFTFVVFGLTLVFTLLSALSSHGAALRAAAATGFEPIVQDGRWWTPLSAALLSESIPVGVLALSAIVVLLGFAERAMGWWRCLIAFVVTATCGVWVGAALQFLGDRSGELWSRHVVEYGSVDPLVAVGGTLMAASAFASALWRRRIRVLTLIVVVMLLLYSGHPADLYRFLAVCAGLVLGVVLRPGMPLVAWTRSSHHEVRVLLASIVAIVAVGPVVAIAGPSRFGPLAPIALLTSGDVPEPGDVASRCSAIDVTRGCLRELTLERIGHPGSVLVSVIPLLLLLVAGYGLLRGRRAAAWVAIAVNGFFALLGLFYFGVLPIAGAAVPRHSAQHYWEANLALAAAVLVPAAVAVALFALRGHFPVMPGRRRVVRTAVVALVVFAVTATVYLLGAWLLRNTGFTRPVGFGDVLGSVLERYVPVSFLHRQPVDFLPVGPVARALYHGVGAVFWLVVVGLVIALMREGGGRNTPRGELGRVRESLRAGGGSLSHMALWPGNRYWFDTHSGAVVAFRVSGGVALTLGGPFGAIDDVAGAVARFARFCDDHGWTPTFYSVDERLGPVFESMGWSTVTVAEESVLDPQNWHTTGKKWQDVRTAINRARRQGISALWTDYASLPWAMVSQIHEISESWVSGKALPEMGFTLGGVDELNDPDVRLMLAVDADDRIHAVSSWLPVYRSGRLVGWTLDFMRRSPDAEGGIMEFLIASAVERMRDDGMEFASLSAAPLARTTGAADATGLPAALGHLAMALEPMYGFASLLAFKRKFQPQHRSLLLAYPDPAALGAIGFALLRAYLPTLSARHVLRLMH